MPKVELTKKGEGPTYEAEGDGYTVVYTPTVKETSPKEGTVVITYADKTFNGKKDDGKHYDKIEATITIKSADVEYARPARQVNQ